MDSGERLLARARDALDRGSSAPEVVLALASALPEVRAMTFATYAPIPGVSQRLRSRTTRSGKSAIVRGRRVSKANGNQWRSLNAVVNELENTADTRSLLRELLEHDPNEEVYRFSVARDALARGWLQRTISTLPSGKVLAVCSRCQIAEGVYQHFPMMDFKCPPTRRNLELTKEALHQLGEKRGVLLESGRSYHYYGFSVLSDADWVRFMGRCLLVAPLTDARYIAHRLIERICVLRITGLGAKRVPRVVEILDT